ncbi:MAG: DUF2760 domain-containing protein [Kiritimatiellae bacterium]|nr:DUF2760 domain-containing protein [Kiritimatiellia bacterium]MDW8458666.1 DUF2760 domain-containing protein [Verrucomicrobiota bacterium]
MSISLAFRCFLKAFREPERARAFLADSEKDAKPATAQAAEPSRNAAVELLAALQREGRLVDFLMEPIESYSDAQIGAAVRDVHRNCRKVLDRMFDLAPLRSEAEGSLLTLPSPIDPALWKINGAGPTPKQGRLCHPGWVARRAELPEWRGSPRAAMVIAPAEVEPA